MFAQLDLWRSTANCDQVSQQQQLPELPHNDLVIDLMSLMEQNSASFQQQQQLQNILEPPPAYPGTPEAQRHQQDDFLMDDEGTLN